MIAFDVDTADCTTLPKDGARSTASGEDDELRVESGESATCTVTAGARLAEALRKSRDVNEPEVSSDMAAILGGDVGKAGVAADEPRECAHSGLRSVDRTPVQEERREN